MSTILTLLQQILSVRLLWVGKKRNLSCRFKLELITTYHMWFVVKILRKYYEYKTSKKKKKEKKRSVLANKSEPHQVKYNCPPELMKQ